MTFYTVVLLATSFGSSTAQIGPTPGGGSIPNPLSTVAINDKGGQVFNAVSYGWVCNGTDQSTAALALLTTVNAAGGGTIYFPKCTSTYRADSQLLIPNDAMSIPNQVNIRMTGAGGGQIWGDVARDSVGAAVLDLRYTAADGNAKIESRGAGSLLIDNLTFKDGGTSNATPFIHSTNTTLTIRGNTFLGSGSATQDAIVLGGASNQTPGSGVTAPFQGYGTIIDSNQFRNLNRGIYGRTFSNSVVVTNNSWLAPAGTRAIEFAATTGNPPDIITGIVVTGNLIEMNSAMVYGVVLQGVRSSYFAGNNFNDWGGSTVSDYRFVAGSSAGTWYNTIIKSFDGTTTLTQTGDVSQLTLNTFVGAFPSTNIVGDGNAASEFSKGVEVKGSRVASNGASGPFCVRDEFTPTANICVGTDGTNGISYIDPNKTGISNQKLELNPRRGSTSVDGPFILDPTTKALANGLNSNVALWAADATAKSSYIRITGPTGAFSLGGFSNAANGTSSFGGSVLKIYNSVSQTMTIVNEDASSSAGNRIKTLTGADVILRTTAPSFVTFIYDNTDARWVLNSTN